MMQPMPPAGHAVLSGVRHWIFDLDGTLTVAVHDFAAIKRALDIAAHEDIIEHLVALPDEDERAKRAWLFDHERELALGAQAAIGAVALLRAMHGSGCELGILTRNDHAVAKLTLEAIGVADLFADDHIIGRDEAEPKPSPAGIVYHLQRWGVEAAQVAMVGDHRMDLAAGRAAGTQTVLVNTPGDPWPGMADWRFADCAALQSAWRQHT
ncbi:MULTISPECIES: HAD family hydrolase [unclassified Stenotrophomonas]|uniref:HAD family hydrolase n=1 Tax=unclassified Stenotrophomonas TaxID=196198 RepID=UPI002017D22A|nr:MULTISPECIES: HAD family hydrolase [unclassified Stenotrophomonas]